MDEKLLQQAAEAGIEAAFDDAAGVRRQADETTLRLLLDVLSQKGGGSTSILAERDGGINLAAHGAYQPTFAVQGEKSWVLSVQLYSLVNERNFGHGDFTDLRQLLELVADAGGGGVGINPLHALAEDDPDQVSPYAPSSRVFLNWLYIDVGELPGLEPAEIDALRPTQQGELIDYVGVAQAKEQALRLAHGRFVAGATADDRNAFARFRNDMGEELRRYAVFCLLRGREDGSWHHWRQPWAQPSAADIASLAQEEADQISFHEFVQWQAHRQLAQCHALAERRALPIGLYLDVAVGVDPDGFDAWNDPSSFLQGATIGAPPDALNGAGQNWGLTGFHPGTLRQHGYAPFRRMLAASMRHAGAIRLDHVLGLNRLYVIPPGGTPMQGAYVRYPLQDLLAVVAQESRRHHCLVIGEDLGTVPDGLRHELHVHGLWTYRVMIFERDAHGFLPAQRYPEAALATFSTHDLPTFAGWRDGRDIELLRSLGLTLAEDHTQRQATVAALAKRVERDDALSFDDIVHFLNATPSRLVAFALEDLMGSTTQINMPGTYREYPNWRHAVPIDLNDVKGLLQRLEMTRSNQ